MNIFRVLFALIIVFSFAGCKATRYTPPKMNSFLQDYLTKSDFKAMTGANGSWGGHAYGWSWSFSSVEDAIADSKKKCRKSAAEYRITNPCILHYIGDKKVGHLSEAEIQQIINDYKNAKGTEKGNSIANSSDKTLCNFAISTDKKPSWETKEAWLYAVSEAKSRSLTPEKCANLLGRNFFETISAAPQKKNTTQVTRPIAISWEGYRNLIAGTIIIKENGREGTSTITLPDGTGTCSARYNFDKTFTVTGSWAAACTNGLAASGTFTTVGKNKGSKGEGIDTQGRKVTFTVGDKP